MSGHLSVTCTRETAEAFTLRIREDSRNLQVGYAEITLIEGGQVRIQGWNGDDDSVVDEEIILRPEQP